MNERTDGNWYIWGNNWRRQETQGWTIFFDRINHDIESILFRIW
jgi:hypothetical protein